MKKLPILLAAVLSCGLFTGCKTTIGPAVLQSAVSVGVAYGVQKDPTIQPYLQASKTVICSLSGEGVFDPALIVAAIQNSPANDLKTPEALLVLNSVLAIYEAVYYGYGDDIKASEVQPYLAALCHGLELGLPADSRMLLTQRWLIWPRVK